MKKKIIIITGPTGVGKTKSSISLAQKLDTEIISADSFQIYKYMDIGTDKIREENKEGIKHHNIDIIDPDQDFNVALFQKRTDKIIDKIHSKNKTPIIVGGTGLYLHSILYDLDFSGNQSSKPLRKEIDKIIEEKGLSFLYNKLLEVDPKTPKYLDSNNRHRIIRAYEVFKTTGRTPSETLNNFRSKNKKYDFLYIILNEDRKKLYENINNRVIDMFDMGLEDELKLLLDKGYDFNLRSFKAIGYKEFQDYFEGKVNREHVISKIQQHSRNYAKRQLTWFRREDAAVWVNKDKFSTQSDLDSYLYKLSMDFIGE